MKSRQGSGSQGHNRGQHEPSSAQGGHGGALTPSKEKTVQGAGVSKIRATTALLGLVTAALLVLVLAPAAIGATRAEVPGLSKPGATGTGKLTNGSATVEAVTTATGSFEAGQAISGTGIPALTRIAKVPPDVPAGTLELSAAASASGEGVALTAGYDGPCATATDSNGYLYVAEFNGFGSQKVRIYNASEPRQFVTEFSIAACDLAIDASGNVYAVNPTTRAVTRYKPSAFPPVLGTTYPVDATLSLGYGNGILWPNNANDVAIDPGTGNIFVSVTAAHEVQTFSRPTTAVCAPATKFSLTYNGVTKGALNCSTATNAEIEAVLKELLGEGNFTLTGATAGKTVTFTGALANTNIPAKAFKVKKVEAGEPIITESNTTKEGGPNRINSFSPAGAVLSETIGTGVSGAVYYGVDVYGSNGRVYAVDGAQNKAYVFNPAGNTVLTTITGSTAPKGAFLEMSQGTLAVDQSNGNVLIADTKAHQVVDEFNAAGKYIAELTHTPPLSAPVNTSTVTLPTGIAYDNSSTANKGSVYVSAGTGTAGAVYAYGALSPKKSISPAITPGGSGTVKCNGASCAAQYAEGSSIDLEANPEPGFAFKEWTGGTGSATSCNASTNPICTVELNADSAITADFIAATPTVTNVNPNTGPTAGGNSVVITGTNFTGATEVKFGANSAAFTVNSATQITATAPAGSAGSVDVIVTAPLGMTPNTAADNYLYVAPPTVTNVNPNQGPTTGTNSVVITGTNFTGTTQVKFGANNATGFTVDSPTQITATAPAGSAGTIDVIVTTDGGSSANTVADDYTYKVLPTVTGLNPTTGPTAGGNTVTITGTNLTGATAVKFGANTATITENTATQIKATAPAGSAGSVNVIVTTPEGDSANTAADDYLYVAAPAVTGLSPIKGPTAGGNTVTITGTNFTGATLVKFGANNATFTVNSATQITATAPAGSAGTVNVIVTTDGGDSANTAADDYTYVAVPTVTGLNPTTGPTAGGNSVVITGTNFTGATQVKFGANNATGVTVNSATQITVVAPAGSAGTVNVIVTTPGGDSANTAADDYLYVAPPTVTNVNPSQGPAAGGNSVVITGTNLTGTTQVKFGANNATGVTVNSPTQVTVTAPAGAAGTVDVIVTTDGGSSANTASDNYTYVAAPTVTALDPGSGPTAGGNQVVVTGTNLTGATLVKFGANNATFTVNSATQITATTPAGAAGTVDVIVTTDGGSSANTAADNYTYVVAPTVVTTAGATGISQTAATVAGTVNPNSGNVTVCKVEYGTTAGYGSQANCASLPGAGSSPANVSASLTGLTAGTTYHFRVVATNAGGTTNGGDQTFTTAADTCATKASLCPVVTPPPPPPTCVVPKLSGKTLGQAKSALKAAKCTLGKVTKPKPKKGKKQGPLVVKSSSPAAGTVLPENSKVNLKLKKKPKKKK